MKHVFLFIITLLSAELAIAQKPQHIYGYAREHRPISWYKEQSAAWKKEVEKDSNNGYAWYNYYRVTRNLARVDSTDKRPAHEKWKDVKRVVEEMEKSIPGSYEYNYCKWALEGNNFNFLPYLKKAEELSNGRTLHLEDMINWGEEERDIEKRDKYCRKMFEAGDVSAGLLFYNHNVLAGTAPNAILFTTGDNDTYPAWVLQSQGFRKDVTVLNLSLLHMDNYRERVFKELGIASLNMSYGKGEDGGNWDEKRFKDEIIKQVAANKKGYPVYVAVTVSGGCNDYINPVEENLYLTGLTYEYSKGHIDNIAVMKRNFEQQYALDYIDKMFYQDISVEKVKYCNGNYVVPMLKLYDHYKASGDVQKQEWIKGKLLAIGKYSDNEQEIRQHVEAKK
jgi:hypothetical protein